MHPRTRELLDHLERSQTAVRTAIDGVPAALRDHQPGPERWSVAQIVEHLAHTAAQVSTLLDRGLRKLERDGLRPATDQSPVLPTIDQQRLLDRERKVAAPATVQPKNGLTCEQSWQTFTESRAALVNTLSAGDGIDVSSIRAPHPALGEIDFHQWIAFVGLHEQRHAEQILETATQLAK